MKKIILFLTLITTAFSFAQEFSLGSNHTLIQCDSRVYVIGNNIEGQLGLGNNNSITIFREISNPLFTNVSEVKAGAEASLIRLDNGEVWSFGRNVYGQLGINNYTNSNLPIKVSGVNGVGHLSDIISIDISSRFGTSMALNTSSEVLEWGRIQATQM